MRMPEVGHPGPMLDPDSLVLGCVMFGAALVSLAALAWAVVRP